MPCWLGLSRPSPNIFSAVQVASKGHDRNPDQHRNQRASHEKVDEAQNRNQVHLALLDLHLCLPSSFAYEITICLEARPVKTLPLDFSGNLFDHASQRAATDLEKITVGNVALAGQPRVDARNFRLICALASSNSAQTIVAGKRDLEEISDSAPATRVTNVQSVDVLFHDLPLD